MKKWPWGLSFGGGYQRAAPAIWKACGTVRSLSALQPVTKRSRPVERDARSVGWSAPNQPPGGRKVGESLTASSTSSGVRSTMVRGRDVPVAPTVRLAAVAAAWLGRSTVT